MFAHHPAPRYGSQPPPSPPTSPSSSETEERQLQPSSSAPKASHNSSGGYADVHKHAAPNAGQVANEQSPSSTPEETASYDEVLQQLLAAYKSYEVGELYGGDKHKWTLAPDEAAALADSILGKGDSFVDFVSNEYNWHDNCVQRKMPTLQHERLIINVSDQVNKFAVKGQVQGRGSTTILLGKNYPKSTLGRVEADASWADVWQRVPSVILEVGCSQAGAPTTAKCERWIRLTKENATTTLAVHSYLDEKNYREGSVDISRGYKTADGKVEVFTIQSPLWCDPPDHGPRLYGKEFSDPVCHASQQEILRFIDENDQKGDYCEISLLEIRREWAQVRATLIFDEMITSSVSSDADSSNEQKKRLRSPVSRGNPAPKRLRMADGDGDTISTEEPSTTHLSTVTDDRMKCCYCLAKNVAEMQHCQACAFTTCGLKCHAAMLYRLCKEDPTRSPDYEHIFRELLLKKQAKH